MQDGKERWQRVRELFEACVDLEPEDRRRYLDAALAGSESSDQEAGLRAEVEDLLARELSGADPTAIVSALRGELFDGAMPSVAGTRIAGYEIRSVLGSGGMGTVYEALQQEPRRVVALKTLRFGLDSDEGRRRFAFEAEVLGRLRHPCIAQVFDAGTHHDAQSGIKIPFFAMEFVEDAKPIDRFADENELDLADLLRLFMKVCDAVHYGHQQGCVHRDLKPGNILVGASGRPKIIDFGIARVVGEETTLLTLQTESSKILGTLHYMSPEQLEADPVTDNRVDVYALGVILYELLARRRPFDFGGLAIARIASVLQQHEPAPPSTVDGARRFGRELDWVVLRAMHKEPERRYASAGELAEDLERFLRNEPLHAGPPSVAYRARKMLRRHRAAVSLILIAIIALGSGWLLARARRLETMRQEAAGLVSRAKDNVTLYRERAKSALELEVSVADLLQDSQRSFVGDERLGSLHSKQNQALEERQALERLFHETIDLLNDALRRDPDVRETRETRAAMWVERWRDAKDREKSTQTDSLRIEARNKAQLYRKLVEESGFADAFDADFDAKHRVRIRTLPNDAKIYLFRYAETEVEGKVLGRHVPLPRGVPASQLPYAPGTWALRLARSGGGFEAEDAIFELEGQAVRGSVFVLDAKDRVSRLLAIDAKPVASLWAARRALGDESVTVFSRDTGPGRGKGETGTSEAPVIKLTLRRDGKTTELEGAGLGELGLTLMSPRELAERGRVRAKIWTKGRLVEATIPAGLTWRCTASALLPHAACEVTQGEEIWLEPGVYMALAKRPGYEVRRVSVDPQGRRRDFEERLFVEGTTPEGFVFVEGDFSRQRRSASRELGEFAFVQEHEVTCAQYLEFLNDPETLSEIDTATRPIRFPRDPQNAARGGFWPREAGRYRIKKGWRLDWPVLGVSWEDADAYARWRTKRARAKGSRWRFALPVRGEYVRAADQRTKYVWGDRFSPRWTRSCFSRPAPAAPEAVMSYPVDESRWGVYDLAGNAFEWSADWYLENESRVFSGGSWAMAASEQFRIRLTRVASPTATWSTYGFRLVALRADG